MCFFLCFFFSIVPNEEWASAAASFFFAVSQIGFELFKKGSGDVTIALPFSLPLAIMLWCSAIKNNGGKPQKASVDHRSYSGGCRDSPRCTASAFLPEENAMWTRALMQVRASQHGLKRECFPWESQKLIWAMSTWRFIPKSESTCRDIYPSTLLCCECPSFGDIPHRDVWFLRIITEPDGTQPVFLRAPKKIHL